MKSLYHQILAAGIPHGNHESDLHIQATPAAWAILKQFPLEYGNSRTFTNQAPPHAGETWIDVPFAYLPWWETVESLHGALQRSKI